MNSALYHFGDIVLLHFPFSNLTTSKQRPAVIISNTTYNRSKLDVVVMAITSQMQSGLRLGEATVVDWQVAGLLKPSLIKPAFATLEQRIVIRKLGALTAGDKASVTKAMAETLGESAKP